MSRPSGNRSSKASSSSPPSRRTKWVRDGTKKNIQASKLQAPEKHQASPPSPLASARPRRSEAKTGKLQTARNWCWCLKFGYSLDVGRLDVGAFFSVSTRL